MPRGSLKRLALLFFSVILPVTATSAQDFQKTYAISAGGHIKVRNISGDVTVSGYDGNSIVVTAVKEGRDRDLVNIEDRSEGDIIDLAVRYPQMGNASASVDFDIRVPRSVEYNFDRISSVSGNVSVGGVTGRLKVESVSGNVDVKGVSGVVSASAVSGDVNADLTKAGPGNMKFSSVSGDVMVRAPGNLDADVDMSTISGGLKTDFPVEISEPRYGPGRSARGRLGAGGFSLRIVTVSGRVSLLRAGQ
ncbi:MAG: DUF4097 family beta strand repeat protein [Acidobacteria bacterium]|nr:DUF4097 family beta strand repeat protein [Acidobacteriota bacterium]